MGRQLKVYQGTLDGRNSYCVAATSWKAAHEAIDKLGMNTSLHYLQTMWTVTGNQTQILAATSEPGTVFMSRDRLETIYQPVRSRSDIYAKA